MQGIVQLRQPALVSSLGRAPQGAGTVLETTAAALVTRDCLLLD
jgi:hypothetical protein